jgi:hypothetical protein
MTRPLRLEFESATLFADASEAAERTKKHSRMFADPAEISTADLLRFY